MAEVARGVGSRELGNPPPTTAAASTNFHDATGGHYDPHVNISVGF